MADPIGHFLDRVIDGLDRVSRYAAWIGGALFVFCSVLIGVEVVLRKVFTVSLQGADEISYYILAVGTTWGLAFTFLRKAHIRVDVVHSRLATPLKVALDVLSLVFMAAFGLVMSNSAYVLLLRSIRRRATAATALQTPLWIPQGLWFAGIVFFTAVVVLVLVRVLWALLRERNVRRAQELAGMLTVEEEIEEVGVGAPAHPRETPPGPGAR